MDANQLLHYLRGFFELVPEPTPDQIRALRNEILQAKPAATYHGGCGCKPATS